MTDPKTKLRNRIAKMSTEELLEGSRIFNTANTREAIIVSCFLDTELEKRLPEAEFVAHMERLEAAL